MKKIAQLDSEKRKLNLQSSRFKEEIFSKLTTAHRSLSNLMSLFETTNFAVIDSKNSLESIRNYVINSNINISNDMEQDSFDNLIESRKRKLNDDNNPSNRKRLKKKFI